jgi:hypothetical protein
MLCGRRKGSILLLGSSWSSDLDGGNPLEDRRCLMNTARRALLAQSLLDIAKGDDVSSNMMKLGEINYHRPKEEIKGRIYPEQVRNRFIPSLTYFICCSFFSFLSFCILLFLSVLSFLLCLPAAAAAAAAAAAY